MKTLQQFSYKAFAFIAMLLSFQTLLMAQDAKVEVNGNDVGTWFGENWMWIAGLIVLLIIIILFSGGSRRRRTTTVERNGVHGHKRIVTTTTEESD